jgi:hypothetical protein
VFYKLITFYIFLFILDKTVYTMEEENSFTNKLNKSSEKMPLYPVGM